MGPELVVTRADGWGEFVLTELTQSFDQPDVSYFFPLMADVEHRLGFRPRCGAFDAFYVYEYFHQAGGFAAVPFSERGGHELTLDQNGLPLCKAGLCPSGTPSGPKQPSSTTTASATPAHCSSPKKPTCIAPSTTNADPRAAAPPSPPLLALASAINSTDRGKPTGRFTNSVRPTNASTVKLSNQALSVPKSATGRPLPTTTP